MNVSVVIPTYNLGALIEETLQSILAQSLPPTEVIVYDDASTDSTEAVVRAAAALDPRIKYFRQSTNVGGVDNWNACIDAATEDLIAFCADDDMFLPSHLEQSVMHLIRHPHVAMTHASFKTLASQPQGPPEVIEYPPRRTQRRVLKGPRDAVSHMMLCYSWPFHASSLVFRRSMWESVGPFDKAFELADTGWWLRAVCRHEVHFLPYDHVLNRRHEGNWSNAVGAVGMHREVYTMVNRVIDDCPDALLPDAEKSILKELWRLFHQHRVLRLAVARGRAGLQSDCAAALDLFLECSPAGETIRAFADAPALSQGATFVLSRLQEFLPGGRGKYADLSVSVPK